MIFKHVSSAWWGPPKKFDTNHKERRVSWLELFFDLVYVIAISRITHHLAANNNESGFLEYICLFPLIYWGWLNGSLHHDLHGNQGLRTRLMTLWQMMIIAALAIVVDNETAAHHHNITIVLIVMQLFITYQWWSVGLYDKDHRRYNWPYTIFFILSAGLMALDLVVSANWLWVIIPLVIFCNYCPPFIAHTLLRRSSKELNLSSSMFERLGLFTIIIFGELVLGVVNGIAEVGNLDFYTWIDFALAISLVFALWWIFFTMIARREAKRNFARASLLELLYIPTLISLGFLASGLPSYFTESSMESIQSLFNYSIAAFLLCVSLLISLLRYPAIFSSIIKNMRLSIALTGFVFIALNNFSLYFSKSTYLLMVILILSIEISYLNFVYYRKLSIEGMEPPDDQS